MTKVKLNQTQNNIVDFLNQCKSKTIGVEAPTGVGKTVAYLYYINQMLTKEQIQMAVISTFSKSLQDQIKQEIERFFPHLTYTVLKGKNNYICIDKTKLLSEHEASLLVQVKPPLKILKKISVTSEYCRPYYLCEYKNHCEYQQLLQKALNSQIVIINHFMLKSFLWKVPENTLLIIDECHHLKKSLKHEVEITQQALQDIEEPSPKDYKTVQQYNSACEKYLQLLKQKEFATKNNIKEPGTYTVESTLDEEIQRIFKCIYLSATFPDDLDVVDFFSEREKRDWSKVKITIEDINYRQPHYKNFLVNWIFYATKNYPKTIILATNYETLEFIEEQFPQAMTTKKFKAIELAAKMNTNQTSLIAGCDLLWTGIDIPGKKCIIMTKLPFPNLEQNLEFTKSVGHMLTKLKQGLGRMLRSELCQGEIVLLDNRITQYPEAVQLVRAIESQGAQVEWKTQGRNVIRLSA